MLYFLVIMVPFAITMYCLVRHMYRLRCEYVRTRAKVLELIQTADIEPSQDLLDVPDDLIVTALVIKNLERCLKPIEQKVNKKLVFISNKNISKKQKLVKLQAKVESLRACLTVD